MLSTLDWAFPHQSSVKIISYDLATGQSYWGSSSLELPSALVTFVSSWQQELTRTTIHSDKTEVCSLYTGWMAAGDSENLLMLCMNIPHKNEVSVINSVSRGTGMIWSVYLHNCQLIQAITWEGRLVVSRDKQAGKKLTSATACHVDRL